MKLKKIRQNKDIYLTKYVFKQIESIKEFLKIPFNSRIYFLGYYSGKFNYFLYKNKVIISAWNCNNYLIDTLTVTDLYVITLLKEYPKACNGIVFETIKQSKTTYTKEKFLNWIDMPSSINIDVDIPYYKIIKFLQNYNKSTFRTKDYLFYSKRDDDYCYTLNLYAKDLRNNAELKLYIPDKYVEQENGDWSNIPPQNMRDFIAVDLSGKLSKNKIRQCKKAFLEFANEYCEELETKNFYALELIRQTIQPVQYECGWAVHRIFAGANKFVNIWVSDFMLKDEEPYFIITDNPFSWEATKAVAIDIKNPKYHNKGIYKQGIVKFKEWKLEEQYIKELIEFFKASVNEKNFNYSKGVYEKYVKTNWQQLIFEYNHNTFYWGWDENGFDVPPDEKQGQLQFNIHIPDYTKLLEENKE